MQSDYSSGFATLSVDADGSFIYPFQWAFPASFPVHPLLPMGNHLNEIGFNLSMAFPLINGFVTLLHRFIEDAGFSAEGKTLIGSIY
jgi:hypothetical protein